MVSQVCTVSHILLSNSSRLKRGVYKLPGLVGFSHRTFFCLLRKHFSTAIEMGSLNNIPAITPPAGVTPNFVNPESQSLMVIISCISCFVVIISVSLLRFYTNLWIKKSFKADDSKFQLNCPMRSLIKTVACVFAVVGHYISLFNKCLFFIITIGR